MLPLGRKQEAIGDWATGCITLSNPPETAEHAGLTKEFESPRGRKSAAHNKPPTIALEMLPKGPAPVRVPVAKARFSGQVPPIKAGTAVITERKRTEESSMPATATATATKTAIVPTAPTESCKSPHTAVNSQSKRDLIVLEHLPLVKAIAVRVHENLPVHVDLDDLVHAGILGLFDAATKFDPEKMVSFSSYAKHRIKGAILDSLRQLDWASRHLPPPHNQLEPATPQLPAKLHPHP